MCKYEAISEPYMCQSTTYKKTTVVRVSKNCLASQDSLGGKFIEKLSDHNWNLAFDTMESRRDFLAVIWKYGQIVEEILSFDIKF